MHSNQCCSYRVNWRSCTSSQRHFPMAASSGVPACPSPALIRRACRAVSWFAWCLVRCHSPRPADADASPYRPIRPLPIERSHRHALSALSPIRDLGQRRLSTQLSRSRRGLRTDWRDGTIDRYSAHHHDGGRITRLSQVDTDRPWRRRCRVAVQSQHQRREILGWRTPATLAVAEPPCRDRGGGYRCSSLRGCRCSVRRTNASDRS